MCPFADRGEVRCATHWTLRNVAEAFRHCAGDHHACPVYRQLVREAAHASASEFHGSLAEQPVLAAV